LEERRLLTLGIDVGHHQLLADTPGQRINIFVSAGQGDMEVTDFLLRAQIGNGVEDRPTPVFQCSDPGCVVPPQPTTAVPWFVGNGQIWDNVSTTIVGGPLFANPPAVPANYQNVAQATVTIDTAGMTTRASGLLVRLEIDTTGIEAGNEFELRLSNTIIGVNSHFLTTGPVRIDPVITNGMIEIVDHSTLRVQSLQLNQVEVDPADLPSGPQHTSWQEQRSDLHSFSVTFNQPVEVEPADLRLTNLGVDAPATPDTVVPLSASQLTVTGNQLVINFPPDTPQDLSDGVYRLEILPTISSPSGLQLDGNRDGTTGDAYLIQGNAANGLFQLSGDLNGDRGVTIFDFPTFAYWFGIRTPRAPQYVDLNLDDIVSIFDFPIFVGNFQRSVVLPTALGIVPWSGPADDVLPWDQAEPLELHQQQQRAHAVDFIWQQPWRLDDAEGWESILDNRAADRIADNADLLLEALLNQI
jgi:hypothetical protein